MNLLKKHWIIIFSFCIFIIYAISSAGDTPYNYFVRLADAFIHGKYYLTESPSWLSELIPASNGRFFVVYPPMPAVILIPFVAIFGSNFPQQIFAHLIGALLVATTIKISWHIKKDRALTLWSGLLIGLGSIVWYMSATGSVWYLGQIVAALFLSLTILESVGKKRAWLMGILFGSAILSRINIIASLPFILFFLIGNKKQITLLNVIKFGLPIGLMSILFGFYNYIRFGNFLENGYFLLPSILNETTAPWFAKGVANPAYILDNIKAAFWTFPKILTQFPYIQPSWYGLAIWITTPAFIFSLWAPIKEHIVKAAWVGIILSFLAVATHGGTGWAQFGYRFAVDLYPMLIFITIKGVANKKLNKYHWLILIIGIVVNLWGVLWINKFGWVSY